MAKPLDQGAFIQKPDERQPTSRPIYPRSPKVSLDDAGEPVHSAVCLRCEGDLEQQFICTCLLKEALPHFVNLLARRKLGGKPDETVDIP